MNAPPAEAPAAPARSRGRRALRRFAVCLQWAINLAVIAAVILVFTPAGDSCGRWLIDVDEPAGADYIVVLGGEAARVVEAANLFRRGLAEKVIISSTPDGVESFTRAVRAYGVPAGAVILDPDATRTADHPRTVAALPGIDKQRDRFIILTSPFHTARARACFRRAGYENLRVLSPEWQTGGAFAPADRGWGNRAQDLPKMFYETLAWGYYKLRGWLQGPGLMQS